MPQPAAKTIDRCLYCLDYIHVDQQYEQAIDRGLVALGHVHSGTCAKQWSLQRATH
jgi:hypothetical protein